MINLDRDEFYTKMNKLTIKEKTDIGLPANRRRHANKVKTCYKHSSAVLGVSSRQIESQIVVEAGSN